LTAAWDIFETLGAASWTQRAARELAATGGTTGAPVKHRADLLTPQEYQVARAAAAGATNREIADTLFLSQKTVEYHLSAIYRRLGLTSRTSLKSIIDPHTE
jgi:DNA-binding NarL/FixJ family response regulator